MLLCTSFTEVACNWKSVYAAVRTMVGALKGRFHRDRDSFEKTDVEEFVDPVPPEDQVPFWLWGGVLFASIIVTCAVMGVQYGQNVGITILGETSLLRDEQHLNYRIQLLFSHSCLASLVVRVLAVQTSIQ
jgi:hypothetical protein